METTKLCVLVSCLVFALGIVRVHGEIKTFRSRVISLSPGEVANTKYKIEMPSGHVGVKSLYADLVDEDGTPVLLSEVYIHHWVMERQHWNKDAVHFGNDYYVARNDGICASTLRQIYGLGSETRHSNYVIPHPYVIEIGNPEKIPDGYEEVWMLNVHTIDTRGTVNPMHCLECRCASYNVSVTSEGLIVPDEYVGGRLCCVDGSMCALREGVHGGKKNLYLQYTVEYFPMEPTLKPVRVYIVDVTDDRTSPAGKSGCKVEYDVPPCDKSRDIACQHEKNALFWLPEENEVDVIYSNGHVHTNGVALSVHREDGREICTSETIYGTGNEAGNEAGYLVGMTSCVPEVGTMRIKPGETFRIKSVYNNEEFRTGVMGLMYLLVADPVANERKSLYYSPGILQG